MQEQLFSDWIDSGATFDSTRMYRYSLWRVWDTTKPAMAFIMLNPSTADEFVLDPTLRRCWDFARRWGFGTMRVGNAYAFRSPYPKDLKTIDDPIGEGNLAALAEIASVSDRCMLGWGTYPVADSHILAIVKTIGSSEIGCVSLTNAGQPMHPLYVPANAPFQPIAFDGNRFHFTDARTSIDEEPGDQR